MQSFLSRLNEYEYKEDDNEGENENKSMRNNKNKNRNTSVKVNLGKFRNVGGMRVVVGKYLGLDDQGKCILPWDWSI